MVKLEKYNEIYLHLSWEWLNDYELKFLTNTPDFTKEEQLNWFNNLIFNLNYKVWGVSFEGTPVGVFGIKNIDFDKNIGEYWGFIGDKNYWGKGLGSIVLEEVLKIASNEIKLKSVYLKVLKKNFVAIGLYKKFNFMEVEDNGEIIKMIKIL